MPETVQPSLKPGGVHRLWRIIAIGLIVGIAAHMALTRRQTMSTALAVRGELLPDPDPRLDQLLETVDFDQVPLIDALNNLTNRASINFIAAWDTLHSAGIERDSLITLHLKHVTLGAALDAALLRVDTAHSASWNEFDGIVHLTTFEAHDARQMAVRFYDVQGLLDHAAPVTTMPTGGLGNRNEPEINRMDDLRKLITDNIATTTWKDNGGDIGSISSYGSSTLIITQTTQIHRRIEAFLRTLEKHETSQ